MSDNRSIEHRLTHLWMQADAVMLKVLGLLLLLSAGLAFQYGEWMAWLLVGLPAFAVPALMAKTAPGALPTRIAIAAAMMLFSALLIQEGHGLVEWHFSVFVLLAFLLYYRDWWPIVVAAGVIAVHHVLFAVLQAYQLPVYVFQLNAVWIVAMHAGFVVAETLVLVLLANRMRAEAIDAFGVAALAEVIASGKLDTPIDIKGGSSPMLRLVLEMQTQLHKLLTEIGLRSKDLDGGSETLSEAAKHAAGNTELQFSSASKMSKSVAELVETVDTIAAGARHGAELTQEAAVKAGEGGTVIRNTAQEIRAIADSVAATSTSLSTLGEHADKIASVIGVIKEIADQTNLLALNAAIEAARAGESGRGFAVVADEVRKLAERTTSSTAEIQRMISDIASSRQMSLEQMQTAREQVNRGLILAEEVTANIDGIIASVEEANMVVGEISSNLDIQAANATLISDQVSQFSASAADSRGTVNQTAALATQIQATAQGLREAVTNFRISRAT